MRGAIAKTKSDQECLEVLEAPVISTFFKTSLRTDVVCEQSLSFCHIAVIHSLIPHLPEDVLERRSDAVPQEGNAQEAGLLGLLELPKNDLSRPAELFLTH